MILIMNKLEIKLIMNNHPEEVQWEDQNLKQIYQHT